MENSNGEKTWKFTKEKVTFFSGLVLIAATFIASELLGREFHFEFLLAGLALCGISIAQVGDKIDRNK